MRISDHPETDTPTDQMRIGFSDMTDEGFELMKRARYWVSVHFSEWCYFKAIARRATARGGYARANSCIEAMRDEFHCKIPNAFAPALARIAMEEDPHGIYFKCGKSKTDGFTTAVLN